ncbi:MAG: biotin/lipoyl-containing protein, partial [Woeseiaceae bacterium]
MANTIDIVVPDIGDFENVEIIEVLVSPGDSVAREDGLITLETDKASFDVPAPEGGTIESLTVAAGDTVSAGDVIGKLAVQVTDTVVITPAIAAAPTGDTTVMATPAGQPAKSGGKQTLVVPDLGDFDDVEVIEVHINPGDKVEVDDPLVTLETDKAAMDVPAVVAGTIESVVIKIGEKVSAGAVVAIIDAVADDGDEESATEASPAVADAAPPPPAPSPRPEAP